MTTDGRHGRSWRPIFGMSVGETLSVLRMAALVVALPVLGKVLSLPRLVRLLDSRGRGAPRRDPERRLWLVRRLLARNAGPFRPKCYTQSLLLFHDLRRLGHDVVIRFAISENEGELEGHSWVELGGEPFGEPRDPRPLFKVVFTYGE